MLRDLLTQWRRDWKTNDRERIFAFRGTSSSEQSFDEDDRRRRTGRAGRRRSFAGPVSRQALGAHQLVGHRVRGGSSSVLRSRKGFAPVNAVGHGGGRTFLTALSAL